MSITNSIQLYCVRISATVLTSPSPSSKTALNHNSSDALICYCPLSSSTNIPVHSKAELKAYKNKQYFKKTK